MNDSSASQRPARALLFLFGLLPYVSTIKWPPIASFWAEWVGAILAAGVAIALSAPRTAPATALRIPLAAVTCLVTALIVAGQLIARQPNFRGAALLAVAELTLAALLCIAAARRRDRGSIATELEAFASGMLVALLLNGLEVLAERNGWQIYLYRFIPRESSDRALGLFGQSNQLAVFSALAWCGAQYLWMRGRLNAYLLMTAAVLVGLNDAGGASRAGAILFVFATVLGGLAMRSHEHRRVGWRLLILGVALFVLTQWWWTAMAVDGNAVPTVLRSDTAMRIELLRDGFALAALHPFTGVGFGNFSAARWEELSWPMGEPLTAHAHNVIAQMAAELGIVAAAVILLPLTFVVLKSLYAAVQKRTSPEHFFVASVLSVIGGYSLTEYPLWYTFFLFPLAFFLGFVAQPTVSLPALQNERMHVLRRGAWALFYVVSIVLAWDYRRTEELYTEATRQQQQVSSRGEMTLDLPTQQVRQIALLTVFDLHADLMLSRTLTANGRLMDDKLPITERVMLAFPTWETIFRHMAFLVAAGKQSEALLVWRKTDRNPQLRADTYAALQRQASSVNGLPEFLATLPKPSDAGSSP